MPGDLRDPEQWMPFHYDERYEPGTNVLRPQLEPVESFIQAIAVDVLGDKLDKDSLDKVMKHLDAKGYLHRHWGDQDFHDEVTKYVKKISMARKVAKRCQI